MTELLKTILAAAEGLNILLLIGLATFFGTVGAKIFQRLHIPQIVGYVTIGIVLGPALNLISQQTVQTMEPFNLFALGIIGFMIGGELKREMFAKFGRQVFSILLFEGLTAFLLVGVLSFFVVLYFSGSWQTALAVGVVFGAICAATDPASTINVLWEYKTRGPLTTMLTAVVAMDDALALVLYAIGVSVAGVITGRQDAGLITALGQSLYHILGSLVIGVAGGVVLSWIQKQIDDAEKKLVFTLSLILLLIGGSISLHLDVILSTMALGLTLINIHARRAASSFKLMRRFSAPVYVLFFVLVGARLNVKDVNKMICLLAAVYVIGSIVGKTLGSYWGGAYCGAANTVKKYLGFCLYPQGGIAVGLLIMASKRFEPDTASMMLLVIIIGAFVLQIVGPLGVKIGAGKAGELGLNITEEDLIKTHKVCEVMDKEVPAISAGTPLSEVIHIVSSTNNFYYPVVDADKKLMGAVTLDGIRSTFTTQELNDWLVALDIVEPIITRVIPEAPLGQAFGRARRLDIEHIPVTASLEDRTLVGVLNCRAVRRSLSAEVLARQQKADSIHGEHRG
jgi:Kef-type K+ transport system membrane component KefB